MKHLRRSLALLALCAAATQAHAIEFWHSDTVWAGQGMCAASFTFDSGGEPVTNLRVALSVIDQAGNNIDSVTLTVPDFGSSNADRYALDYWESDVACDDDLTLVVSSASAMIDDKRQDLLRNNGLSIRPFKPFRIQMAGQPVVPVAQASQTPESGVECAITLEPAEAETIWQQMRSSPKTYLQQCIAANSEMAIQFGGVPKNQAIADATASCQQEMVEVDACMTRPNARAEACVCGMDY